MAYADPPSAFPTLSMARGIRALLWARLTGGFVVLHHILFGLIWFTNGTEMAMMAVTLSTSGLWFLLALGASMGFTSKTILLWHFLDTPDNAPSPEPTPATIFARHWSRRLAIFGLGVGLVGLGLVFVPQLSGLGAWLVISAIISGAFAFAIRNAIPDLTIGRTTQRNRTRAAESTPRARRHKTKYLWKEAALVGIIPVAILHNGILGWLGVKHPTSALGATLYYGALVAILILIAFNWVQYRVRNEEKV